MTSKQIIFLSVGAVLFAIALFGWFGATNSNNTVTTVAANTSCNEEFSYVELVTGYKSASSLFYEFEGEDVCFSDFFKRSPRSSAGNVIFNFSGVIECWQDSSSVRALIPQVYQIRGRVKGVSTNGRVLELSNCRFEK